MSAMAELFRVHLSIISKGVDEKSNLQINSKCSPFSFFFFFFFFGMPWAYEKTFLQPLCRRAAILNLVPAVPSLLRKLKEYVFIRLKCCVVFCTFIAVLRSYEV